MKPLLQFILATLLFYQGWSQKQLKAAESGSKIFVSKTFEKPAIKLPPTPDRIWGKLFVDVQLKMALGDNKTFVDAVPKYPAEAILQKYNEQVTLKDTSIALKDFVYQNFKVPAMVAVKLPERNPSLKKHLEELW